MKTSKQIALLAGVSVAAMGWAVPAIAAVTPGPSSTNPGQTADFSDTLVISNIGDVFFFGTTNSGAITATSIVNSNASGRVEQTATGTAAIDLTMTNAGDATVGATASATNPAGLAAANASVISGILQSGTGSEVSLDLGNTGALTVQAIALADGDSANATANVDTGIGQFANASAFGTGTALVPSGDAAVTLSNASTGTISVVADADAIAELGVANAFAAVSSGVSQFAFSQNGDASVAIDNAGAISVVADATAIAVSGEANADVSMDSAIFQLAQADDGDATASLTNSGTIDLDAVAFASAGAATTLASGASASAQISDAIHQSATASGIGLNGAGTADDVPHLASVGLDNSGALSVVASADAVATSGNVFAFASVNTALFQTAQGNAGADASASVTNSGSMDVLSIAVANAAGSAQATASNLDGIVQNAVTNGGGDASVTLTNSGAYTQVADALANGASASASASNSGVAIGQFANASSTILAAGGDATVAMTNSGTIDISAIAVANATDGAADASANADSVIQQRATSADGEASATLTNSGALTVAVTARANAAVDGAIATTATTLAFHAAANAAMSSVLGQSADADNGDTNVLLDNSGTIDITAVASADGPANATATATIDSAIVQSADSTNGDAFATLVNSGAITISAAADAVGDVFASAAVHGGIHQSAEAREGIATGTTIGALALSPLSDASVSMTNDGSISVSAVADSNDVGTGPATATASASSAIRQDALATGNAMADFTNTGTVDVSAIANAVAASGTASANAFANNNIIQDVSAGGTGTALFDNSGAITILAAAAATGASASASATAYTGIGQYVDAVGAASGLIDNSGSLDVSAAATAVATVGFAQASASGSGISQVVTSDDVATVTLDNSGSIDLSMTALASGVTNAFAFASASTAVAQSANGATADMLIDNSGSIDAAANANAVATGGSASATAGAFGVGQRSIGAGAVTATIDNSGALDVAANAAVTASAHGFADAFASGAYQTLFGDTNTAVFANGGPLEVTANAVVDASSGTASATARGYTGNFGPAGADLAISNDARIDVAAQATAPDFAFASAIAIGVEGLGSVTGTGTTATVSPAALTGSITNNGTLDVLANAAGGGPLTTITGTGTGATTIAIAGSTATAIGIGVRTGSNALTITNTGTINVDAITAAGGDAFSTGIGAEDNGNPVVGATLTIDNDGGTIIARESIDGGSTFTRGNAIDVAGSTGLTVVNLIGPGTIYGNIDINPGDVINVDNGETSFDGIINPECSPVYDGLASTCGQGVLNITADGSLFLRDQRITGPADMYDGPSYAFVDEFNMVAGSRLVLELQPAAGGAQPIGTYPQLFAETANIDGTFEARITTPNGLFADSYTYNNVIDAVVLNGTFDACVLGGSFGGSPLLGLSCSYDALENVDLTLTRTAFDALGGLTDNQLAVAAGIENVYDVGLTGPFSSLVAELFTLDQPALLGAFDQMSGVEYPNYLHAVRNNSFVINSFVSDQLDCAVSIRGIDQCREPDYGARFWVMGSYNDAKLDSNSNAIGYDANTWAGHFGGDYRFGNASIGAFAGYRKLDVDFDDALVGSEIEADGWQLGLTAAYDVGNFYIRGIGSYSVLDGDSERRISIGTITGAASGDPDLKVWSFYGEAGARFDLGRSWITPYVAVDHTSMKLEGFGETGGTGADLEFDGQTESQTSALAGLKWAGNFGGIVPEAKIAYRYDFGDDLGVDARFADAPAGSDFRKEESRKNGSIIAGLSLAGALGSNVTGRIGYQGRFNNEVKDHAAYGALTFRFGGAAPAPLPEVVIAPPPPPATQTCPDGSVILATDMCPPPPPPPPPPAPEPMPERG